MVGFPSVYLLLTVQSLVVVAMALWFRNKLMIIMNSILFMMIFLVYILFSNTMTGANLSFAIVSLVSARLINWKRERFEIKTEMIRNLYLIEGFVMTPVCTFTMQFPGSLSLSHGQLRHCFFSS